ALDRDDAAHDVHRVGVLRQGVEGAGGSPGQLAVRRELHRQGVELVAVGEVALPQEERDLLERHLLGKVRDHVALVDEASVGAVDVGDRGLGADYALEAGDVDGRVVGAHRFASCRGLRPGSGPIHLDAGRMSLRSDSDSRTCAVQPATREVAKMVVKSSFGIPAPVSTTEAQKSTLVAFGRSGCASCRILSATSSVRAAVWCSSGAAVFAISRRILARGSYVR